MCDILASSRTDKIMCLRHLLLRHVSLERSKAALALDLLYLRMAILAPAPRLLTLKIMSKSVPVALDLPLFDSTSDLGVMLAHGAGGGLGSGNLPAFSAAISAAGLPCLRFEVRGPLVHRVAVAKEIVEQHAAGLPGCGSVRRWVFAGHSMVGGCRLLLPAVHANGAAARAAANSPAPATLPPQGRARRCTGGG